MLETLIYKTKAFYRYGCFALLLMFLFLSFCTKQDWYIENYRWLSIVFDCSLFFAVFELWGAYLEKKCKWQKFACKGLVMFNFINIGFDGDYDNSIYRILRVFNLIIFSSTVIYFMVIEKDKACN